MPYRGPKPLVEEHYHIADLIERQERRAYDRTDYQNRAKAREERDNFIASEPKFALKEFFCLKCREDFVAEAILEVEIDWSNTAQSIAFYRTKCFKGHWCMRYVTDRYNDPFWFRSRKVARDRVKHYEDTIQPFQTGYNLLFGKR